MHTLPTAAPPSWSWHGRLAYVDGLALQSDAVCRRLTGRAGDHVYLCEHPHVFTLGRRTRAEEVLWDEAERARRGVSLHAVDRGGAVTYHGPGQLVGYPVVDLSARGRDLHAYLRDLEEVLLALLASCGVSGERRPGLTGVWVGGAKIAAIGVHVSRWVTSHGFALNVAPDLDYFRGIVPCGLHAADTTSLAALGVATPPLAELAALAGACFARVFAAAGA